MISKLQLFSIFLLNNKYTTLFKLSVFLFIYFCFCYNKSTLLCMNEDSSSTVDWKKLYFASETKKSELQAQIQIIQNENLDLSLENLALRTEVEEQKLLRTADIKRVNALEQELSNLKEMLVTEKTIFKQALGELVATKNTQAETKAQLQEYQTLNKNMLSILSEAKRENITLKQRYEHINASQSSEHLGKRRRHT